MVDKLGTCGEYQFVASYLSEAFLSWWPAMFALGTRVLAMML
jgi:hypothetical protein